MAPEPAPTPGSISRWAAYLPDPDAGAEMVAASLITLVFSLGGLVVVAIRRRQW